MDRTNHYLLVANYGRHHRGVRSERPTAASASRQLSFSIRAQASIPTAKARPTRIPFGWTRRIASHSFPDLGLDKIFIYRFDASDGSLTPNDPPFATVTPGYGPRHFDFDPAGKFVYVMNEMASKVKVFAWDSSRGVLTELQTISSLSDDFTGTNTSAEIRVHPSGRFLYCTNRGDNTIAAFAVDSATGLPTFVERVSTQGKTPRNFDFDPTGHWLIVSNMDSDNVLVYKIDLATGKLIPHGAPVTAPNPFAVRFLPVASSKP